VVKLDSSRPAPEDIRQAAEVVDGGGIVAFPTETVYGLACAAKKEALKRLGRLKGRNSGKAYSLHIGKKERLSRYVPKVDPRARKLVESCWPGPLTIVFELDWRCLAERRKALGAEIVEHLYRSGSIGVRCPANRIASALLEHCSSPVVAPSANMAGAQPAVDAVGVLREFSGEIELVLDGGRCKFGRSSTVVKVGKGGVEILRAGVYSAAEVESLSEVKVLIVCTGNTCRSPMAAGMFKKYLAEKLGCGVDQLGRMGYKVVSAGVIEMAGLSATEEAVAACLSRGVDISNHRSQPLSRSLVEECDYIFGMERMHLARVAALSAEAADKCRLLAEGDEIADPIGQEQAVYDRCAEIIERAVKNRIGELGI